MGEVRNIERDSGSNTVRVGTKIDDDSIVCLEGNGARPSHKGDGFSRGGLCIH